jgi:hypothetical protein
MKWIIYTLDKNQATHIYKQGICKHELVNEIPELAKDEFISSPLDYYHVPQEKKENRWHIDTGKRLNK